MKFVIIGISDNTSPWFPPEVMEIIKQGKVFSGGKRHHEIMAPFLSKDAEWIDITVPLDAVFHNYHLSIARSSYARLLPRGRKNCQLIIVFASGDPLFFGFANTIRRKMPEADIVVYPTFNSLQMLAHRLVMPYHDMRIVSLTGRPWPEFDRALIERAPKIGILTDREHTPAAIAQRMLDYGYTSYIIYIGEHLGNPEKERITKMTLEEAARNTFALPNCVIAVANSHFSLLTSHFRYGIPDSAFTLLDGREKMITKMPIRLLTLQALDLPHRHTLWDIGFCTGSISIEARLLFPHLHIEAFEIRPECEAIMEENCRHLGAPGINIHIGDFRSVCCDGVAAPDAVFIGGHGGHLKEIMAKVKQHLAPGGCIVMNSVTVLSGRAIADSRRLFEEACQELGLHLLPATHIVLNDNNPIDILKCELPL